MHQIALEDEEGHSLSHLPQRFVCGTDSMRYIVKQLEFEIVTRYYIGYDVYTYFSQFIMSTSLVFKFFEAILHLGASLTGE